MLGPEEVVDMIKSGETINDEIQTMYGIIPRAIRDFFEFVNQAIDHNGAQFQVFVNYFEIYKESINNLLVNKSSGENLKISNDKVLNAEPVAVVSPADIFALI